MGSQFSYTVHDLIQWLGLISAVLGIVWWYTRDRRTHRADIVEITRWRTSVERDVQDLRNDAARREAADKRIFDKLDEMCAVVHGQSDRLLRIETLMEAGRQPPSKRDGV